MQISHLSVSHKKDLRPLIEDLSFVLREGDRCAVIGEEGNGKSTLLKIIAAPEEAEEYVEFSGEIRTGGAVIGYLKQELSESEKAGSVYEYFSASPGYEWLAADELMDLARQLSVDPGLFYDSRPVGSLSGGEKVKLQLARLLMGRPDILLLDEPSGDLDLSALKWLERFILTCGRPVLYVSHDEMLLERTANMVIHLELVRRKTLPRATVQRVGYREYVDRRLNALSHQEQMARDEQARFDAQQKRLRELKDKVNRSMESLSRAEAPHAGKMLKRKMHAVTSMGKRFEREAENMTQMPDVEEAIALHFPPCAYPAGKRLEFRLPRLESPGGETLAEDIRLVLNGPEKVCIVGRNGAGKTTLLRALWEQLKDRNDMKAAYMPQNYFDLLPEDKTPAEFLAKEGSRAEISEIRAFLGSVKYTPEEMDHPIAALSGGQKGKLLFISMIRSGAQLLLLDEPTRNFSPLSGPVIRRMLTGFTGGIISVSHDRRFIAEVAETVYQFTESGLVLAEKEAVVGEDKG